MQKKAKRVPLEKNFKSRKSGISLKGAIVACSHSNHCYTLFLGDKVVKAVLAGRLKNLIFEKKNPITVGQVVLVDVEKSPNRIEQLVEPKNSLERYVAERRFVIASNIDNVVITTSCKAPLPKLALIDRFLCFCAIKAITPIVCINKIDLQKDLSALKKKFSFYIGNGVKCLFVSAKTGENIEKLKENLVGKTSIFTGQSGVGKSSILNAIQPNLALKVGEISSFNKKGKHITSASSMFKLDCGGFLMDTAGIKTFALSTEKLWDLPKVFPSFAAYRCKFNDCCHINQLGCLVEKAVKTGIIPEERYLSYKRLFTDLQRSRVYY